MKHRLLIVVSFFLWSTSGIFVRESGLSVPNFVVAGNLSGIALLLLLAPRRLGDIRKLPFWPMLGMSAMGAINVWTSFAAFKMTSLGNVMIPHYAAPVFVALFAPLTIKELPSSRTWEALGLSMLGLVAVAYDEIGVAGADDLMGIALAFGSGLAYAVVILCGRRVASGGADSVMATVVQSSFLPIIAAPFVVPSEYTGIGLCWAVGAGALHLMLAAILYLEGLKKTPATTGATIGYLEVIFAMTWGVIFYSEAISIYKIAGAVLIVCGGLLAMSAKEKIKIDPVGVDTSS